MQQNLLSRQAKLPFSFSYGRESSKVILPAWHRNAKTTRLDGERTEHLIFWRDSQTGLEVRCRAVEYHDFPTLEWTLYFRNTGTQPTPVLSDIHAIDAQLLRKRPSEFLLHYNAGDNCSAGSYEPFVKRLATNTTSTFAPDGGRPTNGRFPYFNVEYDSGGVIAVLGWPGQWSASFVRDGAHGLNITGGQELTHLKLLPGEEIRTPLVVLQFWRGDWVRSQNLWRRWMVAHNLPGREENCPSRLRRFA